MGQEEIKNILSQYNVCALVGPNSQGKSTALQKFKNSDCILIDNEVKANEYIKNSVSSSPLIQWLEKLLDINFIQDKIKEQLKSIDLADINNLTNVTVNLDSATKDYKGLVNVDIITSSNQWKKPGSGETFVAELLLIKKMLKPDIQNPIKYLVIDEPETFLHPSLFIKVCDVLKEISQYTKIIIATHSPEFLNYFVDDLGSIIYVQDGSYKQLYNNDECLDYFNRIPFYNKILSMTNEELENNKECFKSITKILNKLDGYFNIFIKPKIIQSLFAKVVVLGEGRSEKILFECFKEEKRHQNYMGNVDFIDLYGKEFMLYFSKILNIFGIKTIIIFDEDKNRSDELNLSLNKELLSLSCISFEYDLEKYLLIEKEKSRDFKPIFSPISIYNMYKDRDEKVIKLIDRIEDYIINVK